jgi:outer membrane receptor protein involved in Fe transport
LKLSALVLATLLGLGLTGPASAAEPGGRLEGKVSDTSGGPLPGAHVSVEGPVFKDVTAGAGGVFRVSDLKPGEYKVRASLQGFKAAEAAVKVAAGEMAGVALSLEVGREETMVVTATRAEMRLADAPAAVTVIDSAQLEAEPSRSWADVLRSVPGINAVQTSARDMVITSRQASSFFAGSEMVLVDGRPLFFDFFNIVFWDLASVGMRDLDQVEVLRGPAAVMWGSNAATGVINMITKSPRQTTGVEANVTWGMFGRPGTGEANGSLWGADARWGGVLSDTLAARLSAGFYRSDAFARPTGMVPLAQAPLDSSITVGGGSYDAARYNNQGTQQPRVDLRVDQELDEAGRVSYSAGYAGTQGIIQTPIGPFQLESGAGLTYGRIAYTRGGFHLTAFANYVDAKAPNLITDAPNGQPLRIDFNNGQYDLDTGYTALFGRHLLSAGASVRYNTFDISLAPDAKNRLDAGAWLQDDIDLDPFRVALAIRADKPENVANALVSPRLAIAWSPVKDQVIRASYNRAYRVPSAVENYVNASLIGGYLPLGLIDPRLAGQQFPIVTTTLGNPNLKAQTLEAWELSWQGKFGRTQLGLNVYLNDSHDTISSIPGPAALRAAGVDEFYTSANPPAGWPLPPAVLDLLAAQGIYLPRQTEYLNLGTIRNHGLEFSVVQQLSPNFSAFANYSYQAQPELRSAVGDPLRPQPETVSVSPRHRVNSGASFTSDPYFASLIFNFAGSAYWADSNSPAFYGFTPSYHLVNAVVGRNWAKGRLTTSLRAMNLAGEKVQQQIFGDILGRTVVLDVGVRF